MSYLYGSLNHWYGWTECFPDKGSMMAALGSQVLSWDVGSQT
jgi:hypothetical protein